MGQHCQCIYLCTILVGLRTALGMGGGRNTHVICLRSLPPLLHIKRRTSRTRVSVPVNAVHDSNTDLVTWPIEHP
ncbi:hypothetical protein B0H11DRAFT_2072905 [Mycena galericulata]|nr:hypothetical protein B0H11DRAFT_2072905 [Mycena galericulata]